MRRGTAVVLMFLFAAVMCSAGGATEGAGFRGRYSFGGSTTIDPIIHAAIEAYSRIRPQAVISYDAQGSGPGIAGVASGVYSLGGSSRELTREEKARGLVENPIALDGILIIVNAGIPVADLSRRQIADVFNGTLTNWRQIGGADAPIVVVTRDEASGSRIAMADLVLTKEYGKGDPRAVFLKDAITVTSNGDMVSKVGSTPNAIGYCGEGFRDQARGSGAVPVSVDGVAESTRSVLDATYPLSRRLYMVSKGPLREGSLEKQFIDFLLSDEGRAIVAREGYIPLPR